MADTFTETTYQSWGSRMKNSIAGVLLGIVLFLASFVVIWTNESRSVQTAQALAEVGKNVISLSAPEVAAANEGKLVHVSGSAKTADILSDPLLGVSANAIKLAREAEMYQWAQHSESRTRDKVGGGQETVTTYTYKQEWSDAAVDSSDFRIPAGHANPAMSYQSEDFAARNVALGGFALSNHRITCATSFCVTPTGRAWPTAWRFGCHSSIPACWAGSLRQFLRFFLALARQRWR